MSSLALISSWYYICTSYCTPDSLGQWLPQHHPHISPHLQSLLATSSSSSSVLLFSIISHVQLLVYYSVTSVSLSLDTYTFLSFNTRLSSTCHSSSLNTFTSVFFISSTTLITLSSFSLAFFIFSTISTSGPSTTTSTSSQIHSFFISFLFSLFFSIPTFQSGLLLNSSAFSIFAPSTCFKTKSNLDKYNIQQACFLFNFCAFMKYSKFLWSVQTSNLDFVLSNKCL